MTTPVIPKRNLKQINEALYALVTVDALMTVLENAGEDTAALAADVEHLRRNLKAYRSHITGKDDNES